MIELWNSLLQALAAGGGFLAALSHYFRKKERGWFLLACFYGVFALGTLYWTLHLLLRRETPQIFYVSDLAWTASCCWVSDDLRNPYFWFDFALSGGLLLLLPGVREAVEP